MEGDVRGDWMQIDNTTKIIHRRQKCKWFMYFFFLRLKHWPYVTNAERLTSNADREGPEVNTNT